MKKPRRRKQATKTSATPTPQVTSFGTAARETSGARKDKSTDAAPQRVRTLLWLSLWIMGLGMVAVSALLLWRHGNVGVGAPAPGVPTNAPIAMNPTPPNAAPASNTVFDLSGLGGSDFSQQLIEAETGAPETEGDWIKLSASGKAALAEGRLEDALRFFQSALSLNPADEEEHFNLGFTYGKLGRPEDAIKHYTECLRLFPEHAEAHGNLGNLLVKQNRFEEAIEHFNAALASSPDNASAHNNLGNALARQGNLAEAIRHFEEAVLIHAGYAEAHSNIGNVRLQEGKFADAIASFQKSLSLNPQLKAAQSGLARAMQAQSRQANPP